MLYADDRPTSVEIAGKEITGVRSVVVLDSRRVQITHDSGIGKYPTQSVPQDFLARWGINSEIQRQQEASIKLRKQQAQKAGSRATYDEIKAGADRMERELSWTKGPDIEVIKTLIPSMRGYVKAYESGNKAWAESAYAVLCDAWDKRVGEKPVYGYEYNESLRDEVVKPVDFGMSADGDGFYVLVGEGDFSTLARISREEVADMIKAMGQGLEWIGQSEKQKLNTTRALGRWGGISLEFASKINGDISYFWLEVQGSSSPRHLMTQARIRLGVLNYQCLLTRMRQAGEKAGKQGRAGAGSYKLK
jgi:hypothetical protein